MSGNAYRRGLFRAGLLIFGAAHRGQRGDAGGVGAQGLSSGMDGVGNPSLKWTFLPNAPVTRRLRTVDTGEHVDPSRMTVADWLNLWLASTKIEVSPKTHERYGEIVRCYLVPGLGGLGLQRLTPTDIQTQALPVSPPLAHDDISIAS